MRVTSWYPCVLWRWWIARNLHDLANPGGKGLDHLKSCRDLWVAYNPSFYSYYYEVVECCRRVALTGAAVFVLPDSVEQIAVICLLFVVFTFIFESLAPFQSKADIHVDVPLGECHIILASMCVALILKA